MMVALYARGSEVPRVLTNNMAHAKVIALTLCGEGTRL